MPRLSQITFLDFLIMVPLCFEAISELKVNFFKNGMTRIRVDSLDPLSPRRYFGLQSWFPTGFVLGVASMFR